MGAGPIITCRDCGQRHTWGPDHQNCPGAPPPDFSGPGFDQHATLTPAQIADLNDLFSREAALITRRRDRWTGAITVLLIIAMLALAIFTEPTPTNTCQPNGTLTKATL